MKKETVFSSHFSALTALFILGNSVMVLPVKGADEYSFLGYLIAIAIAFLLYFAVIPVANRLFADNKSGNLRAYKKILLTIIYLFTAVLAVLYAAETFLSFISFASTLLLKSYPKWVAVLIFLAVIAFFLLRRQEDFLKFTLLAFCFTAAVIVFFFIASVKNLNFNNIVILNIPNFKELLPQIKTYALNPVLPTLLMAVYGNIVFKKARPKDTFWGLGIGFTLLAMCILNSVLLFGAHFAAALDYPYASAVSTVTIGRLFTRLDGFSYFVYFASALAKIIVCLFITRSMLEKANKLKCKD